jgi:hypothetical protein
MLQLDEEIEGEERILEERRGKERRGKGMA